MCGGNTRDYANIQFLLKLPYTNYNIFQCSLTALILTVAFAYWGFCGSLVLSIFVNWSYFMRRSWNSSLFVYFHIDFMDIYFTLQVIIQRSPFILLLRFSQLWPLRALVADLLLCDCSGDSGLEEARVEAGKPGRKLMQQRERVMVWADLRQRQWRCREDGEPEGCSGGQWTCHWDRRNVGRGGGVCPVPCFPHCSRLRSHSPGEIFAPT